MKFLWRVFNRRVAITLLVVLLVISVAVMVNVIGIQLTGDIQNWERWLKEKAAVFFVWRLFLYAGTVYGWLRMRKHVLQRETTPEGRNRLKWVEIYAAVSIVLLEATNFLAHG